MILNRGEGGGLTVNLQGPLVFNPVRRLGRQLVLTSSRYAVRYPLERSGPGTHPAARSVAACERRRDRRAAVISDTGDAASRCERSTRLLASSASPVVVTESPGNVIRDGHGSRWQEEGA